MRFVGLVFSLLFITIVGIFMWLNSIFIVLPELWKGVIEEYKRRFTND